MKGVLKGAQYIGLVAELFSCALGKKVIILVDYMSWLLR